MYVLWHYVTSLENGMFGISFGIAAKYRQFIESSMYGWKAELRNSAQTPTFWSGAKSSQIWNQYNIKSIKHNENTNENVTVECRYEK